MLFLVRSHNRNIDALLNLGALLVDLGDVEQSLKAYEKAMKVNL